MHYFRHAKFLSPALIVSLLLGFSTFPQIVGGQSSDGGGGASIRADLPLGGELRVENRRGGISVEVWNEKHVAVSAVVEGAKPRRSPIIIQRTEQLLAISVARETVGAPARVDLTLRVPERSRAEILSTDGEINVRGVPASLSVRTTTGSVYADLLRAGDLNVRAESTNGMVVSRLPRLKEAASRSDEHTFQARLGAGDIPVELNSESGRITITSSNADAFADTNTDAPRKRPVLIGAEQPATGAGTPSTPLTSPEEVEEGDVVRVDAQLVTLNVSVIDRSTNRGLKGLVQSDFKLFEDGSEQSLTQFAAASAPFNLVLLIDLSLSTEGKIGVIREAALQFVNSARPADRIAIVTFTHEPVIVSRLTSDRALLRQRVLNIETPRGSTNVYDSLAFTMEEIFKDVKDSRRNAIVLMSDGVDSTMPNVPGPGSSIAYEELLGRVREFDGVLYSIWLDTSYEALSPLDIQEETFDLAYDRMKELSDAGGGIFYEVDKVEDLGDAYERVVADLGTVYSLSYRPTNSLRDGKWRAIRVSVARPNAVARGKRGYYAN